MSGTILICYDGSEGARRAIDAAAALFSSRRAVVLNVGAPLDRIESAALMTPATLDFEHVNAAGARELAGQGAGYARRRGFEAKPTGGVAAPVWETIVNYAEEIDADLIVLGSRALSSFADVLKAGVSHKVAEHAGRAVFLVPPPHGHAAANGS